jgi:hypothetical protein
MAQYADGTDAELGDAVVGRLTSSGDALRSGVLTSIAPDGAGVVHYVEVVERGRPAPATAVKRHGEAEDGRPHPSLIPIVTTARSTSGDQRDVYLCADTCMTEHLVRLDQAVFATREDLEPFEDDGETGGHLEIHDNEDPDAEGGDEPEVHADPAADTSDPASTAEQTNTLDSRYGEEFDDDDAPASDAPESDPEA